MLLKRMLFSLACIFAACLFMGLCVTPFEQGNWSNIDRNTRGITRVDVKFFCQDQVLNGVPCCPTGDPYRVHLYGSCSPSDCDWGEVTARRLPSGHIYAYYNQGFARRHDYLKPSSYREGALWMYIYTDFTDPGRRDYSAHYWFRK